VYSTDVHKSVFLAGKPEGIRAFLSCELVERVGQIDLISIVE